MASFATLICLLLRVSLATASQALSWHTSRGYHLHTAALSGGTDGGQSALHLAAYSGDTGAVDALLGVGARLNLQDDMGRPTIHWAAKVGRLGEVQARLG